MAFKTISTYYSGDESMKEARVTLSLDTKVYSVELLAGGRLNTVLYFHTIEDAEQQAEDWVL